MRKEKKRSYGFGDADRDERFWRSSLGTEPKEKKRMKVMIPISSIISWFKRRKK